MTSHNDDTKKNRRSRKVQPELGPDGVPVPVRRKREYNQTYYSDRKEAILAARRERYRSDPELRERIKLEARARRLMKSRASSPGGQPVFGLKIGELGGFLGVPQSRVQSWVRTGTLPATPLRTPGGFRLYSPAMASAIVDALQEIPEPTTSDDAFFTMVADAWTELGVDVDRNDRGPAASRKARRQAEKQPKKVRVKKPKRDPSAS